MYIYIFIVHTRIEHRSLIRFPRTSGIFWAERMSAVKRWLTVAASSGLVYVHEEIQISLVMSDTLSLSCQ